MARARNSNSRQVNHRRSVAGSRPAWIRSHAATAFRAQLLGQKRQDPVEGNPGRMPRLVDEGDREHRVRRRRDPGRVARRRVDLDPLEGCPSVVRRVSNRSGGQPRSLVNRSPSTRSPSFVRSVIVERS